MGKGVTCAACGASTPLPDDLRTPSFACRFCGATMITAEHAGEGAVRVEQMKAFLDAAVSAPGSVAITDAPKLVHGNAGVRAAPCVHCGAEVSVPLDIMAKSVSCGACGRDAPIRQYLSDAERLRIDMARQVAGNEALKALIARGVTCGRCGASNVVPQPIEVQLECAACRHVILLADHVPADAVDRARLKHGVLEMQEALRAEQRSRSRITSIVVGVIAVVAIVAALVSALLRGSP